MDYSEANSTIKPEDFTALLTSPEGLEMAEEAIANTPNFPVIIFIAALIKDSTDIITLGFLGILTGPILSMIIFFHMFGKSSFTKKMMWKWFLRRFIWTSAIEILPGFSVIPITTTLVVRAHFRESKLVKELDYIVGEVYRGRELSFKQMKEIAYA